MNETDVNRVGFHRSGYFVRVLLVLVLLMQVVIAWQLFEKSDKQEKPQNIDVDIQAETDLETSNLENTVNSIFTRDPFAISRRDPFREMDMMMESAFRDMARLRSALHFDDGWDSLPASPALDMRDTDTDYIISVSLPRMDPDDIDVSLDGRLLKINATAPVNGRNYSSFRSYEQNVLLPGPIGSTNNLAAFFTNGVLRVTVSKDNDAKSEPRDLQN